MENIAPIQIAEPKREKRAAVTAAYRRGYADALEDMRKRQREKKRRRQYFIIQKLNGIALLAFTALAVYILEGDATIAILTVGKHFDTAIDAMTMLLAGFKEESEVQNEK